MSKRSFRGRVGANKETPTYPHLDQLNRRTFLSRLGLGALGVGTIAAFAGCDHRAVGQRGGGDAGDAGPDRGEWETAGVDTPPNPPKPDLGNDWATMGKRSPPDLGSEPDAWELTGGASFPDDPPSRPDLGPDADSEEWEWDGGAGS